MNSYRIVGNKKLVIIESDDWGAERLHSENHAKVIQELKDSTVSNYDKFDGLETAADLESLLEVLKKYDAVFTLNYVLANPDYQKIAKSDFRKYFYRPLYGEHLKENLPVILSGMEAGLFCPEFHAPEHLSVKDWLSDLRDNKGSVREFFNQNYYASRSSSGSSYLNAYRTNNNTHLLQTRLKQSFDEFETYFYKRPSSFCPCNYVLDEKVLSYLTSEGIENIQTQRKITLFDNSNIKKYMAVKNGGNLNGMFSSVRNVLFEPALMLNTSGVVNRAMRGIELAFLTGNPAIISSHRVNYTSRVFTSNRKKNLMLLDDLFKKITRKWPDVKFIASSELKNYINDFHS